MWAVLAGVYSGLTLLKRRPPLDQIPDVPLALDAAAAFALGVLIVLRTSRAYERWWEARRLWGTLVNVSRNLAVKVRRFVKEEDECERMRKLIVANCYALKDHLRDENDLDKLDLDQHPEKVDHIPSYLASQIYELCARWHHEGKLDDAELWLVDQEARILLDVCGGCERIKTTLMSVSWRVMTRQCIILYVAVAPWGLVDDFGVWTIPISVVIAYLVFGGEWIASFVEEPFGKSEDHLDLDRICRVIEATVDEIMADRT